MKLTTLQQADEYVRRGRLKQAVRVLQRAVQAGDAPLEYYLRLAEVYRLQDNWHDAINAVRAALQCNPHAVPVRERLVELLIESGQLAEAVAECRRWLRETPDHPIPLEHMLDAYWQSMDYEHALQVANHLVQLQPQSAHYRLRRARLLDNLGRYAQAISDYEHLAFDVTAPLEIIVWAIIELERLDKVQMEMLLHLLTEDAVFRIKFLRDPIGAARERGFVFSRVGEQMLEHVPNVLNDLPKPPRRYADYN
ncbi:MAG: tetratricopeptide repeat protein [Fimbriimonadales bacterium]|nr:tetratricopeptide repeat protein [Fimbriimonadales bacterium]